MVQNHIILMWHLAGHIESWGRGIEKIFDSCRENYLPLPIYHVNSSDIMIEFNAPDRLIIDNFVKVTEKVTDKVTDKMELILGLLIEDPAYSYIDLARKMNLSRKTIATYIKKLKDLGYIERIGTDRKGYWKIIKK